MDGVFEIEISQPSNTSQHTGVLLGRGRILVRAFYPEHSVHDSASQDPSPVSLSPSGKRHFEVHVCDGLRPSRHVCSKLIYLGLSAVADEAD